MGDLPLEAYYGGAELKLLAEMIRLQLGADWDEVRNGLGFDFCLLFTTRADGRLNVKVIKPGNSTQPTAQTQATRKLAQAVSALPPHLMGSLLTTDGHVFPYRLIAGRPIGVSPDNPYRHKWVLTDCLYCATWKEVEKNSETLTSSTTAGTPRPSARTCRPATRRLTASTKAPSRCASRGRNHTFLTRAGCIGTRRSGQPARVRNGQRAWPIGQNALPLHATRNPRFHHDTPANTFGRFFPQRAPNGLSDFARRHAPVLYGAL
mgnify:CR=1 FL=1